MTATLPEKSPVKKESTDQSTFLIIGYGDLFRGDAGVGQRIAQAVRDWQLSYVKALAVPELQLELVNQIAASEYVLFVNACSKQDYHPHITPLSLDIREMHGPVLAHPCSPKYLLNLNKTLYNHQPQAWLLESPAQQFEIGHTLSSAAQEGIFRTLDKIALFLRSYTPIYIAS